jgi:hypothetical protein
VRLRPWAFATRSAASAEVTSASWLVSGFGSAVANPTLMVTTWLHVELRCGICSASTAARMRSVTMHAPAASVFASTAMNSSPP